MSHRDGATRPLTACSFFPFSFLPKGRHYQSDLALDGKRTCFFAAFWMQPDLTVSQFSDRFGVRLFHPDKMPAVQLGVHLIILLF